MAVHSLIHPKMTATVVIDAALMIPLVHAKARSAISTSVMESGAVSCVSYSWLSIRLYADIEHSMRGTNIALPMTSPDATNSPYGTSVPGTLSTSRPTPKATPRSIATGSTTMNARAYFQNRMNASQCLSHSAEMLRGLMPSMSRTSGLPRAAQSC